MTTTLASILRADGVSLDTFKDDWEACGGALKVRFMRNDFLDTRTSPRYKTLLCERGSAGGPTVNNTRCRIFATDETLGEFDTLVVNSGAHPRAAHEFGRQMDAASAALTKSMHRLHGKDKAVLVVRNTIPGHWDCTERYVPQSLFERYKRGRRAESERQRFCLLFAVTAWQKLSPVRIYPHDPSWTGTAESLVNRQPGRGGWGGVLLQCWWRAGPCVAWWGCGFRWGLWPYLTGSRAGLVSCHPLVWSKVFPSHRVHSLLRFGPLTIRAGVPPSLPPLTPHGFVTRPLICPF